MRAETCDDSSLHGRCYIRQNVVPHQTFQNGATVRTRHPPNESENDYILADVPKCCNVEERVSFSSLRMGKHRELKGLGYRSLD